MPSATSSTPIAPGDTFGCWTVLRSASFQKNHLTYSLCRRACGIEREVQTSTLKNGRSKGCRSCGATFRRQTPSPQSAPCEARPAGGRPETLAEVAPPVPATTFRPRPARQCLWTDGERGAWRVCEGACEPGKPFCADHCRTGFTRAQWVAGVGWVSA